MCFVLVVEIHRRKRVVQEKVRASEVCRVLLEKLVGYSFIIFFTLQIYLMLLLFRLNIGILFLYNYMEMLS